MKGILLPEKKIPIPKIKIEKDIYNKILLNLFEINVKKIKPIKQNFCI